MKRRRKIINIYLEYHTVQKQKYTLMYLPARMPSLMDGKYSMTYIKITFFSFLEATQRVD